MIVKTSQVTGRRQLCFESFGDLLLEAESLAQGDVVMLGNWTLGQVFLHLSLSMHASIDGLRADVTWWQRLVVRLLYGRRLLSGPMPAGLRLSPETASVLLPPPIGVDEGLATLREAVERLSFETERARHPLLGDMSLDQWDSFHLRHAELHLSFARPLHVPVPGNVPVLV
ncbi:MAG TPA: DUF1569 domain-containing protein [Pirellulales bacterium]|nr:DUF1569 domain-containing protein [Pirellulales bacterium]